MNMLGGHCCRPNPRLRGAFYLGMTGKGTACSRAENTSPNCGHSERRRSFAKRMIFVVEEAALACVAPFVTFCRTVVRSARLKQCPPVLPKPLLRRVISTLAFEFARSTTPAQSRFLHSAESFAPRMIRLRSE